MNCFVLRKLWERKLFLPARALLKHSKKSYNSLTMDSAHKQIALIVLDGWGYREDPLHNAIAEAKTPFFDHLWNTYPHTLLQASGHSVGLPDGQMGNSEVGHTTIGAGRIVDTDLVRIHKAIESNQFVSNLAFQELFAHVKKHNSTMHVKGLLGPGGVHAHSEHLYAFLRAAKENGIVNIALHVFLDGRDTPPRSGAGYLEELEEVIAEIGIGYIATASGRFFSMDRDNNWDRLKKAEEAMWAGKAKTLILHGKKKASETIRSLYDSGQKDEQLEPIIFLDDTGSGYVVKENDGIFIFNFRSDRARMLTQRIAEKFEKHNVLLVTMTEYGNENGALVAFPKVDIETTLAAEISKSGLSQAHIAETEKFPHATYFLNGGREVPHLREEHIVLPSRRDVDTHDLAPKMRAEGIADRAIEQISNHINFIFINFANPDMVGHTGNVPAIIEAVEEVDRQLKRVVDALVEKGGVAFVTADHGNAEVNIDPDTGETHTAHTTNPVPAILTDKTKVLREGGLSDITPTILQLFTIKKPESMSGSSLLA
jgi:2,3-bisphosphoglycerate-independent phosphoglycerate mutase